MEDFNHNMMEVEEEQVQTKMIEEEEGEGGVYPALPQEVWLQVLVSLPEADRASVALVSNC
jgi:hypothetical protein